MRKSLMRITLRQLEVFRAVNDNRSYSRAAEQVALTQPAVSLQIRQLEALIGQPLFEYVGKKLYLTEAGELLVRASDDLVTRLETLEMQLSDLEGALQGQLRLAVESSAKYITPHLFAQFQRRYPAVDLQLFVGNRAQLIKRLADNRDDLTLMSLVPQDMALEFFPFLENAIVAVATPDHPLCQRQHLELRELSACPLIVRESGSGTRRACEEYFQQKRTHFQRVLEVASQEAQREAVLAGLGIALLPWHAVHRELKENELRLLPVAELPLRRSWCVVHPRGKRLTPVASAFFAHIREHRREIAAIAQRFELDSA